MTYSAVPIMMAHDHLEIFLLTPVGTHARLSLRRNDGTESKSNDLAKQSRVPSFINVGVRAADGKSKVRLVEEVIGSVGVLKESAASKVNIVFVQAVCPGAVPRQIDDAVSLSLCGVRHHNRRNVVEQSKVPPRGKIVSSLNQPWSSATVKIGNGKWE
jgi:hypothetical protein